MELTSVEICTGAGGQALGLEKAGFIHSAVVEIDHHACETLRFNRGPKRKSKRAPEWNIIEADLRGWDPSDYKGVALLAGGVPCPPFSKAGRQLGAEDERDLFPVALDLVDAINPKAVMLENVRGLLDPKFADYRAGVEDRLDDRYQVSWRLLNASDFGVPQLRPRVIMVAIRKDQGEFTWPEPKARKVTVGKALEGLMERNGWDAKAWVATANKVAPTLVGGSKKHGGPDLGPTRARTAWQALGVDGRTIAEEAPPEGFDGTPRLTVEMAARLQGFPPNWHFVGRKTHAYRQVGNAFPPPVAKAVGLQIVDALEQGGLRAARKRELDVVSEIGKEELPDSRKNKSAAVA